VSGDVQKGRHVAEPGNWRAALRNRRLVSPPRFRKVRVFRGGKLEQRGRSGSIDRSKFREPNIDKISYTTRERVDERRGRGFIISCWREERHGGTQTKKKA